MAENLRVDGCGLPRRVLPRERLDALEAKQGKLLAFGFVCKLGEACRDGFVLEGVDEKGGVSGDFGQGRTIRSENRQAVGHGFEHGHAEAFIQTGKGEDGGFLVEAAEFVIGYVTEEFDSWVRFGGGEHRVCFESKTPGDPELPRRGQRRKGVNKAGSVLALLHGSHGEHGGFAGFNTRNLPLWMNAVRDNVDALGGVVEVLDDLVGRELADGDNVCRVGGGVAGLFFEAAAKVGRRVFGAQDKEVVECRDTGDLGSFGQALVEAVEEVAGAGSRFKKEAFGPGRAQEAMGSIV